MAANLPEITYRFPTLISGAQSASAQIVFDWNTDMETTQFSNASSRAANIVLLDEATSTVIPTDFVSYTAASRRVTLAPASGLTANRTYRVLIKPRLLSTDGRRSYNEYHWTFLTASGSVNEVNLLAPGNYTVQPIGPTLQWSSITYVGSAGSGLTVNYKVELSTLSDFSTLNFSTTTTAVTALPNYGSLTSELTYYWRVMPLTTEATGFWSDTWNFFYGRSVDSADPTSRQYLPDADTFGVKKLNFKSGTSNVSSYPATSLAIVFTSVPASTYSSFVEVWRKSVLPRNDIVTSYNEVAVSGTWSQSSSTLFFTPSETIANNTRYEIRLKADMINTAGLELGEDYSLWFTSRYSPFYVSPRVIRARFLGAEQKVPDDMINFFIYQASLEANARFYAPAIPATAGDSMLESTVRDSASLTSYGVLKWVEAATALNLLKAILFENLRDIGRTDRLGDSLVSLTKDFVAGLDKAIEFVKEEIDQWDDYLTPSSFPGTTSISSAWTPYYWDSDWSIPIERQRDDDF